MSDLSSEQQKIFVDDLMKEHGLTGASKKRMIMFLGEKYNWDKQKVQFKLKRAILAQKYAESH